MDLGCRSRARPEDGLGVNGARRSLGDIASRGGGGGAAAHAGPRLAEGVQGERRRAWKGIFGEEAKTEEREE